MATTAVHSRTHSPHDCDGRAQPSPKVSLAAAAMASSAPAVSTTAPPPDLTCRSCKSAFTRPVALPCGHCVCYACAQLLTTRLVLGERAAGIDRADLRLGKRRREVRREAAGGASRSVGCARALVGRLSRARTHTTHRAWCPWPRTPASGRRTARRASHKFVCPPAAWTNCGAIARWRVAWTRTVLLPLPPLRLLPAALVCAITAAEGGPSASAGGANFRSATFALSTSTSCMPSSRTSGAHWGKRSVR